MTDNTAQFTINDLNAVAQIISVASSRGAFRAEELSAVGGVYDKIVAFLKAAQPEETQETEEATTEE